MALLQWCCTASLTTSLALQSVVHLGAQAVASSGTSEGGKSMEIGLNQVLIQFGKEIGVYSFGQGLVRNEYFLDMVARLGKLHYALPVSSSIRLP